MVRRWWAVVAVGILAFFWVAVTLTTTRAEESVGVSLAIQSSDTNERTSIGDTCGEAGLDSNAAEYPATRQLVVENADGRVVATASLRRGVLEEGIWGRVCNIDVTLELPVSDFYTLSIFTDGFRYTFTRDQLTGETNPLVIPTDQ